MKVWLVLGLLAVTVGVPTAAEEGSGSAAVTREMRDRLLHGTASEFSIQPESSVWGVLMETGYDKAAVTLVALGDGTASLYFSSGGGVIGGGEHPPVAASARRMVSTAVRYLPSLEPAADFPLPAVGRTRFYVLTTKGVMTAETSEESLGNKKHPLSPLFYAGQDVITGIRLSVEERKKNEK